ncbi:hypothetical protein COV18_06955 [Candidatus Woesearchaeota archaeon CG10_big_fil_rev_8_21_14_0_10_37_12]|nr:MAG: hypothetical protein COV18_06955 [Candidatus Woesearchaeota archaeon CG10_big_fil_rev_8_21_14_0_10_37_12]
MVMKIMHVHAKSNTDVTIPEDKLKQLPKLNWGIVTTIQHEHKIQTIIDQLKTAKLAGQVLGCNASEAEKINDKIDAWLFVGSGIFHPIQVALKTGKDVWLWNPDGNEISKLDSSIAEQFRKRKQGELNKFLHAKIIGVIVSTKIGQKNLMRALDFKSQTDKECYVFACDELNMQQFENFNFIDFWVNTACPRIADEKSQMVNIDDLIEAGLLKLKKEPMAYEVPIWKSKMGLKKE